MEFETLLAKSFDEENGKIPTFARLLPHLRLVEDSGKAIFEMVGEKILQQADLNNEMWRSRLKRSLTTACLCHDIGKANDGFQKMIRGLILPTVQPIRHELISALLLAEEGEVRKWALHLLSENRKYDDAEQLLESVIAAVGGHHRKLDEDWKKASIAFKSGGCGQAVNILLTHDNLKSLFNGKVTKDIVIDLLPDEENSLNLKHLDFRFASNRFRNTLELNDEWRRFAAILKALTSAADVAGSALPEKEYRKQPSKWVEANLKASQFVTPENMRDVVKARLKENPLRHFQTDIARSRKKITLVEAGCGTGKTAGAYAWGEFHANGKKLFFCYPTTGTATEGFLGYVAETDVEAELIHSRAIVDKMLEVKGDEENRDDAEIEKRLRIESLKLWSPQVIICTADTVLSLVRNNRRGWYNSPAILSGAFVFDELHAYDNRMFAGVIALIKALPNASFLLMTASLPKARKEFLLRHLGEENIKQIQTPKELEELARYNFERLNSREDAYEIAEQAKTENLKILWICNTVGRSQEVFDKLKAKGLPVETYHSSYKYEDRKTRHRAVIDGFDREKSPDGLVAVTTQVAEMSLDLDADILIFEIAAVPAMIQRLGRVNRFISIEAPGKPRIAYFYIPEKDGKPYKKPYGKTDEEADKIFEQSEQWLRALENLNKERAISQADLAEHFQQLLVIDDSKLDLRTNWLDSGWFAEPESVRDPNPSVSTILPEDEDVCRQSLKAIINKSIPVSYRGQMKDWKSLRGNLIAPPNTIDYSKVRGAKWRKQ